MLWLHVIPTVFFPQGARRAKVLGWAGGFLSGRGVGGTLPALGSTGGARRAGIELHVLFEMAMEAAEVDLLAKLELQRVIAGPGGQRVGKDKAAADLQGLGGGDEEILDEVLEIRHGHATAHGGIRHDEGEVAESVDFGVVAEITAGEGVRRGGGGGSGEVLLRDGDGFVASVGAEEMADLAEDGALDEFQT